MLFKEEVIKLDYSKIDAKDENHKTVLKIVVPNTEPEVVAYTPKRPTVLVLPGGGYAYTSEREADPIAFKYLSYGFNVAVLYYSCAPAVYPVALIEALQSIKHIRENAEKYNADPDAIYVCGFSAGGHLAASCGTHWHRAESRKYFENVNDVKPNGLVLAYPVITSGECAHRGSFDNLLGEKKDDKEMLEYLSLEKQVDKNTPETFVWTTFEDSAVPCENSIFFALAFKKHSVPVEMHMFRDGEHGLATADNVTKNEYSSQRIRSWLDMSAQWIKERHSL